MNPSARLYHCLRCHGQVIVCSHCDRGNRYCSNGCAQSARQETLRRANQKYRSTRRGRFVNALRQQRYRHQQRQKVTHQGSQAIDNNDLLPGVMSALITPDHSGNRAFKTPLHCHFCQCQCGPFLRLDFIRRVVRLSTSVSLTPMCH